MFKVNQLNSFNWGKSIVGMSGLHLYAGDSRFETISAVSSSGSKLDTKPSSFEEKTN
jgi:hypothetical protein